MWPFTRKRNNEPELSAYAPLPEPHPGRPRLTEGPLNELGDRMIDRSNIENMLGNRNAAIQFPGMVRATTLISAICADMVCEGALSVRDRDGRRIDNRRTRNVLDLVERNPDNNRTTGINFIEDALADYCLDGNALIVPVSVEGQPFMLRRYRPWDAHVVRRGGEPFYHLQRVDDDTVGIETFHASQVMHIRWPRIKRYGQSQSSRDYFATPPVITLRDELRIGTRQAKAISDWFDDGAKPGVHFDIEEPHDAVVRYTEEQRKKIAATIERAAKSDKPTVTFNTRSSMLETGAQDQSSRELRDFQIQEVARFFGLPLPLMSVPIGQWTRGVNEQVLKMAWRTGFKPHLNRVLAPLALRMLRPGERFFADPSAFIRGDAAGIAELTRVWQGDAQRDPVATREELRHMGGLPKHAEGEFAQTRQIQPAETGGGQESGSLDD